MKVDNSSAVNALLKVAHHALEADDTDTAIEYFEKALQKDPMNWEAKFYINSLEGTIYTHITTFGNAIYTVLALIQDNVHDSKRRSDAVRLVMSDTLEKVNRKAENNIIWYDCSKKRTSEGYKIDPEKHQSNRNDFQFQYEYFKVFCKNYLLSFKNSLTSILN